MRINENVANLINEVLLNNKGVSHPSFTQQTVDDISHTINAINGLQYGKGIINDCLLSEYVHPQFVADMIVPVRIRFADSDSALDFKSEDYNLPPVVRGSRFLTPEEYKNAWLSVLNSMKPRKDWELSKIEDMRLTKKVDDMILRSYSDTLVQYKGDYFCPVKLSMNFNKQFCYNMEDIDIFSNWFTDTINAVKNNK